MKKVDMAKLRREYAQHGLLEKEMASDPTTQFSHWLHDAVEAGILDANAVTLATASRTAQPSARIVLLKDFDAKGFVFFTNYGSRKGRELLENPKACLLFYWAELERQVRVDGTVEKISPEESTAYFKSRPFESQVGAWVSEQSAPIPHREFLEKKFNELLERYRNQDVPLPEYWGGYRLIPSHVEFWQGRPNRLHDRLLYTKQGGAWTLQRLAP